jgi:transposase
MDDITYVGLDVHKPAPRKRGATVCVAVAASGRSGVAVAASGRSGEVRQIGVFENRPQILCKMAARLGKGGRRLSFCYEAGPCGYRLHRLLTGRGRSCVVVAPSLIPMKPGDRIKTDRRDAMMLAKLHRAGELTAIWIPDAAHEAMRDLVRARATAGRVRSKARQPLWRKWGDFRRFTNARQLMAYLGLVPSEYSSGSTIRRGGITTAGNALARRVLIEGAWTYRMNARVSRKLHDRLEPLSAAIRDIAWKA